jgi:hypothetical protein
MEHAQMPPANADIASRKSHARSRVSNGNDILPDVDGRSLIARRYRDIAQAILIDQGDASKISEARLQLIRRFSAAAVLAEMMEAALAKGAQINIQEHALLCSTLTRLASRIGINRIPKEIEQTLSEHLQSLKDKPSPIAEGNELWASK